MPTSTLPEIKFTDKDSQSLLDEMVAAIPGITDKWTDHNASDIGQTILELLAWGMENLLFYLDHQANEAFLATARERRNVIRLAQLIGYKLSGPVGSLTTLVFSLPSAATVPVPIPKFTACLTKGDPSLTFATVDTVVIPTGETQVSVGARQGVPTIVQATTNGQPGQTFTVPEKEADSGSFQVVIDGVIWTVVDSFANAQSGDRVYTVEVSVDGTVSVRLGDGFFGVLPAASSTPNVTITYLVTRGSFGNAGIAKITTILSDIFDLNGDVVSISVSNPEVASGGDDAETIEHVKVQAPAELSALFRAMTKGDFKALAEGFAGVGKAGVWGEAEVNPPEYRMFNWVMIVVAPENVTRAELVADPVNNGKPSSELKRQLRDHLYDRATITTKLSLIDPSYRGVELEVGIFYEDGALASVVQGAVEQACIDAFEFDAVNFGEELRLSSIYKILTAISGVSYVQITKFKLDGDVTDLNDTLVLQQYELPYLMSLTLGIQKAISEPLIPALLPTAPLPNPLSD